MKKIEPFNNQGKKTKLNQELSNRKNNKPADNNEAQVPIEKYLLSKAGHRKEALGDQ